MSTGIAAAFAFGGMGNYETLPEAPPAPAQEAPQTICGLEILGCIGEGAGSTIYAASDPRTQQIFALKHVVSANERDERFLEQVSNEFSVSKTFRHPGLRRCVDLKLVRRTFQRVHQAALLMELVDGQPLNRQPPRDLPAIIDCFTRTAEAVVSLHESGLIHCDIKPNNILRLADRGIRLIDFGQTCPIGTVKNRIQGTPDFIAPEQVECEAVDYRTDVYNFGATFYWALTGRRAPTAYTVSPDERSILLEQRFPQPHQLNVSVPNALSKLVMECVMVERQRRPATMREVMQRIDSFAVRIAA